MSDRRFVLAILFFSIIDLGVAVAGEASATAPGMIIGTICRSDIAAGQAHPYWQISPVFEFSADGKVKPFDEEVGKRRLSGTTFYEFFDGKIRGKVTAREVPTVRTQFSESPLRVAESDVGAEAKKWLEKGFSVIAATDKTLSDPDQWQRSLPDKEATKMAKDAVIQKFPNGLACLDGGIGPGPAKKENTLRPADLTLLKRSFKSKNGDLLFGLRSLLRDCDPDVGSWATTWVFVKRGEKPKIVDACPSCTPIDTAAFGGGDKSKWLFGKFPGGDDAAELYLFSQDFELMGESGTHCKTFGLNEQ